MKNRKLSNYTSFVQMGTRQAVLLKNLNFEKAKNAAGIFYEFFANKTVLKHKPVILRMEPSNHCNLRCPTCHPEGNTFGGTMTKETFDLVMERYPVDLMLKSTLYLYGEPFMNPRLPNMLKSIHDLGVSTSISTNFNIFDEKKANDMIDAGLDWILICIDGASQESYEKYRVRGKLQTVLDNTRLMVDIKKKRGTSWPLIEVQSIVFEHNKGEIDEIRDTCLSLGVERFTTKQDVFGQLDMDAAEAGSSALLTIESEPKAPVEYVPNDAGSKKSARCLYLYGTGHVDYDGTVLPCCVGRTSFGNLSENTFEEIWNNDKFVAARTFFASGFKEKATDFDLPCYSCPLFFKDASGNEAAKGFRPAT